MRRLLVSSFVLLGGCFEETAPMEMTSPGTSTQATMSATAASTVSGTAPDGNTTEDATTVDGTETTDAATASTTGIGTVTTGPGTLSSGSDGSTGDPPVPVLCPFFEDDFEDGREAPIWIQEPNSPSVEADGEWTINVSAAAEDVFARMRLPAINFEGATVRFEIGTPPADDDVLLILWMQQQGGGRGRLAFNLIQNTGQLELQARVTSEDDGPPGVVVDSAPWEPDTQRWMQLREDNGIVYFETSEDGATFVPVFNISTPIALDNVSVGFVGHNRTELPDDVEVSIRHFELDCGASG